MLGSGPKDPAMITITKGSSIARISPERGAIVTSLEVDGCEALYLDQETFDDPSKNVRGGIPVLFPICGPTPLPSYRWGDGEHAMKQHGFARNLEWQVVDLGRDRLVLEIEDSEATHGQYPFAFRYQIEYRALATGLRIGQVISNLGEEAMPLQFGFHPYFQVGEKSKLQFDLPVSRYRDNRSEQAGDFEGFDFSQPEIDWSFPDPTSSCSGFVDPERGLKIEIESDPLYSVLVFWTLQNSPFVCLEPWSDQRLAFPEQVKKLEPGDSLSASVDLRVSKT